MACCHYYAPTEGGDEAFSVDTTAITFGAGCLGEAGDHAQSLGMKRVALFTDAAIVRLPHVDTVKQSLTGAGMDVEVYAEVRVEPTDDSFKAAARFATEGRFDGYVSVGGGSVMDTCKAANLYATHPAEFLAYVNAPIGDGRPIPGSLKPHIACPTTSGTGSECTGITIFDLLEMKAKTGIASKLLKPSRALVDPLTTHTMPRNVIAASSFDVLSHALESYTARPYTARPKGANASDRPLSQGANPWSDIGCKEALRIAGEFMVRAVTDANDTEAREQLMWGATLAGIAFGNSGVHVPHGMSYAVAGLVKDFRPEGYPQAEPICPHGMSVIVNAPAVFRHTASACPERHIEAAGYLGADLRGAGADDAAEVVAGRIIELMRATDMPNGVGGVGYTADDVGDLTKGALPQKRLLDNAPCPIDGPVLDALFEDAMRYW